MKGSSGGNPIEITFEVPGVTRPIVSVGELARKGFSVDFGPERGMVRGPGGVELPLRLWQGAYYLPFVCGSSGRGENDIATVLPVDAGETNPIEYESDGDEVLQIFPVDVAPDAREAAPQPEQEQVQYGEEAPAAGEQSDDEFAAARVADGERGAEMLARPVPPSDDERQRHSVTHLPYASWCPTCVAAKARQDPHRRRRAEPAEEQGAEQLEDRPLVQFDFTFLRVDASEVLLTALSGVIVGTGFGDTVVLERKALSSYAVSWAAKLLARTGHATPRVRVDQEPALEAIARKALERHGGGTLEEAPAGSHQSQGSVERWHASLQGQARVLIEDVRVRMGKELGSNHAA